MATMCDFEIVVASHEPERRLAAGFGLWGHAKPVTHRRSDCAVHGPDARPMLVVEASHEPSQDRLRIFVPGGTKICCVKFMGGELVKKEPGAFHVPTGELRDRGLGEARGSWPQAPSPTRRKSGKNVWQKGLPPNCAVIRFSEMKIEGNQFSAQGWSITGRLHPIL
jgi:hypothetical protein